jgi:hypothetical protein
LCFFRASFSRLRFVVASSGRDGWVPLVRKSERLAEPVVGRAYGKGIVDVVVEVGRVGLKCGARAWGKSAGEVGVGAKRKIIPAFRVRVGVSLW